MEQTTDAYERLIVQYETLCRYCDDVFADTVAALGQWMRCAKGCASCCVLETVNPLEAAILRSHIQQHGIIVADLPQQTGACVFLHHDACAVYAARPIICRTHGLPLAYPEQETIEVCPLNFTDFDLGTLDPASFLDAERITDNLMRLNLAFCMLTNQPDRADERIPLQRLVQME